MKTIFELIMIIFVLITSISCNNTAEPNAQPNVSDGISQIESEQSLENVPKNASLAEPKSREDEDEKNSMTTINITVGDSVFLAKLYDNETVKSFLEQFPLTLNMSDLNGNEKYYYLTENLPSDSTEKPSTINAGDIMCWSGNCLVLFYKNFSNSYGGYVRLGYIEDVSGLTAALGSGSAEVKFTVSE